MRYALNVTQINGWETHLGSGSQALSLSVDASARKDTFGAGLIGFDLEALAQAYARKFGQSAINQTLTAQGDGTIIPFSGGHADLALHLSGIGVVSSPNIGLADIIFAGEGQGVIALKNHGIADMVLGAFYGIPARPTHAGFIANTDDRTLLMDADDRHFDIPADPVMRPQDDRALSVDQQNRSA